ncbi:MAG: hypothetical protein ABW252_24600 [Polyangiales bacterium]
MTFTPLPKHARFAACALGLGVLAGAGVGLATTSTAAAQAVDCLTLPNPVLGIGGSAATNLIKRLATRLAAAPTPITVVYTDTGACNAMTALVQNTPLSGTGKYWGADGKEQTCNYASGSTTLADWGAMAQEATTCQGVERLPDTVGAYKGPVSGFSLIVPNASSESAISAEAIYYIYGFGVGTGQDVAPWTQPAAIGSRTTTSAAGLLLAKAVGIPLSRKLAHSDTNDVKSNQAAVDFVTATSAAAVANPSSALAFCSTETADANRAKVRTLAFKAQGQDCAYFPDSTSTATDKKNLREGRYYLWNSHYFFARTDASKKIVKPAVETLIKIFASEQELPGPEKYIDLLIANGNVPECAMQVTRATDMGPLASYQPAKPCGCYFDQKTTGSTTCKACTADAECGTGSQCSYGYCEVK